MAAERDFLGTGWAFPPSFDGRTLDAVMVSGQQDVRESLRILLSTVPGERVMHPSYGCGLRRMVFEQLSESLLTEIRSLIEKAILFFEQRIVLERIDFDTTALAEGVLRIGLFYQLRATNTRDNMVYPFYLGGGAA